MNELQAKLARRRTLNGEGLNGASSKDESSTTAATADSGPMAISVEPEATSKKALKSKPATPSRSSAEELQIKLARRRNLNGETIPAQPAPPEPTVALQEEAQQVPNVSSAVANETMTDPESLPHDFEPEATINNQYEDLSGLTTIESQAAIIEGVAEEHVEVSDNSAAEVAVETSAAENETEEATIIAFENPSIEDHHIPETTSEQQPVIDERDYDTNPEFTPLNPEVQVEVEIATAVENEATNEEVKVEEEEQKEEELPHLPPPPIPPPIPPPPLPESMPNTLFQSVEDTMNMIDQEISQLRPSIMTTSSFAAGLPISATASSQEPEVTYSDRTSGGITSQETETVEEGSSSDIPPPIPSFLPPPPLAIPPSIPLRSESDERNLSFSANTRPLSTSSPVSSKSRKSQDNASLLSPTTRESISSPSAAGGKGWYPGKYILQRINSTSSISPANTLQQEQRAEKQRKSSQIISMNQEQAQSYYNALINNDAAITPPTPSAKSRVFNTVHDENEERSMIMLIEENVSLKSEIMRLQDELDRRQAIIDSYQLSHLLTRSNSDSFNNAVGETSHSPSTSLKMSKMEENMKGKNVEKTVGKSRETNDTRRRRVGLGYYTTDNNGEDDDEDDNLDLFGSDLAQQQRQQSRNKTNYNYNLQKEEVDFTNENNNEINKSSFEDEKALFGFVSSSSSSALIGGAKYDPRKLNNNEQDLIRSYNYSSSRRSVHPTSSGLTTALNNSNKSSLDAALFGPETSEETTPPPPPTKKQSQPVETVMEYEVFLQRFVKAADLQDMTRKFIFSVLGPQGDTTEPHKKAKLDYVFYGTHRLDERCLQFFDDMQERFRVNRYFKDLDEESLTCARDCLEQHVMNRLGPYAFKLCETTEDDVLLERRMKVLSSFMTPEMLDIKPDYFNETLLAVAATELKEINIYRTPREKANCVVKCVTIIFRSLSVARVKQEAELMQQRKEDQQIRKENGIPEDIDTSDDHSNANKRPEMTLAGADDFLPLFIWVVLQSRVPRLYSNCEYVQAYLNPARLKGQPGYCLINLHSAVSFLTYLDPSSLNVDPVYFEQKMSEAEEALGGGTSSNNNSGVGLL